MRSLSRAIGSTGDDWFLATITLDLLTAGRERVPDGAEERGALASCLPALRAQVENLFFPGPLLVLDEYGVPLQVATKLERQLVPASGATLDTLLERLRGLDPQESDLGHFEQQLVRDTQRTL